MRVVPWITDMDVHLHCKNSRGISRDVSRDITLICSKIVYGVIIRESAI